MKEKIIEILSDMLIEGLAVLDEDDIDEVSDKIAGFVNQEVEKRIAERMPSERLREELIAYDKYASRWIDNYRAETAEDCVDEYLKSKEQ